MSLEANRADLATLKRDNPFLRVSRSQSGLIEVAVPLEDNIDLSFPITAYRAPRHRSHLINLTGQVSPADKSAEISPTTVVVVKKYHGLWTARHLNPVDGLAVPPRLMVQAARVGLEMLNAWQKLSSREGYPVDDEQVWDHYRGDLGSIESEIVRASDTIPGVNVLDDSFLIALRIFRENPNLIYSEALTEQALNY